MLKPNPPGRHSDLTDALMEHILSFVEISHIDSQVARLSGIAPQRISTWLKLGREHMIMDTRSVYAQFAEKYDKKMGNSIHVLLERMCALEGYQSVAWMLEKCHREDFGNDGSDIKELRQLFKDITLGKELQNGS